MSLSIASQWESRWNRKFGQAPSSGGHAPLPRRLSKITPGRGQRRSLSPRNQCGVWSSGTAARLRQNALHLSKGLRSHFTLFIHLRIGPVTLVSAVSGDITSEMWL